MDAEGYCWQEDQVAPHLRLRHHRHPEGTAGDGLPWHLLWQVPVLQSRAREPVQRVCYHWRHERLERGLRGKGRGSCKEFDQDTKRTEERSCCHPCGIVPRGVEHAQGKRRRQGQDRPYLRRDERGRDGDHPACKGAWRQGDNDGVCWEAGFCQKARSTACYRQDEP